jgi:hypothetical protein
MNDVSLLFDETLFLNDAVTEIDALVAYVDTRPGDQLLHLILRLSAE